MLAYLYIEGADTHRARSAYRRDPEWAVPRLWRSEFRSVLSLYMRRQLLSHADAVELISEAELWLGEAEYEVQSAQVLRLVASSTCSA